jgi:hypothetical protein
MVLDGQGKVCDGRLVGGCSGDCMGCLWDVCMMVWGWSGDGMGWYGMLWDGMVREWSGDGMGWYWIVWDGMGQLGLEKMSVLRKPY